MVWVIAFTVAVVLAWRVAGRRADMPAASTSPSNILPAPHPLPSPERSARGHPHDDATLRRDVQHGSSSWGAGRFAVELARRDHDEWLASSPATLHPVETDDPAKRAGLWGPVQSDVEHLVIEPDGGSAELRRSAVRRHPSVPRPSTVDEASTDRRGHRRRRGRDADAMRPVPLIPAHELARLTPAARRLYGLPPVAD